VPTYLQLVHQVGSHCGWATSRKAIACLRQGSRQALAINPIRAERHRELEHRGLAAGRPGQGTFIAGTLRRVGLAEQKALRKDLLAWLRTADDAGLDAEGMEALFASSLRDFLDRRDEKRPRRGGNRAARSSRQAGEVA
jgi:GntR family transcriptional regulator